MEQKIILSVKKALDVLDILAFEDLHHKGVSLTYLSRQTGIKPNTLHTILKTMAACGYVEQNAASRYLIGKRCRQIGILNQFHLTPAIGRRLEAGAQRLSQKTGESVSFYVLENGDRINYINVQSNDIIKVDYTMLEQNSIYEYPSGKILVAYCSPEEREKILQKHGYPKEAWEGISTGQELDRAIEAIRKDGYSKQVTERGQVASYAGPVFDQEGNLLGSIGVYLPSFRRTDQKEALMIQKIRECFSIEKEMFAL